MTLKIGQKAPAIKLPDQNGKIHELKDYSGQWVLVYFYPKDDTPGCTIEANDFNELRSEFEKNNAVVLGISRDDLGSHEKFKNKYNLKFHLGSDSDGSVCNSFGSSN